MLVNDTTKCSKSAPHTTSNFKAYALHNAAFLITSRVTLKSKEHYKKSILI